MSDEEHPSDDSGFDAEALAALARPSGAPPAMDDDGDAGVLDLRALAASAAPSPSEDEDPEDEPEEAAPVASAAAAASADAPKHPAAVVAARPSPETKGGNGLVIGLGIGLAAAAAVFFLTRGSGTQEPTANAANPPGATAPAALGARPPGQEPAAPPAAPAAAPDPSAGPSADVDAAVPHDTLDQGAHVEAAPTGTGADAAPAPAAADGRPTRHASRHATGHSGSDDAASQMAEAAHVEPQHALATPSDSTMTSTMTATMTATMRAEASGDRSSGDRSMDALLNSALGGQPSHDGTMTEAVGGMAASAMAPAAASADLPDSPSRSVVTHVLGGLMGQMRRCAGDQVGMANARIRIANDGSVASVAISGSPFGGTPQGRCMENVVRRAHFPRFRRSNIDLTFPFSIRPLN